MKQYLNKRWAITAAVLVMLPLLGVLLWKARSPRHEVVPSEPNVSLNPAVSGQTTALKPDAAKNGARIQIAESAAEKTSQNISQKQEVGTPVITGASPALTVKTSEHAEAQAPSAAQKSEAVTPAPDCLTVTYKRTDESRKLASADLAERKNLLKIKHRDVNSQSICVRVNQVPVAYQTTKNSDEILIAPISEQKAEVSIRYCVGKAKCQEDCTIPEPKKDEFMEAIGGNDTADGAVAKWDPDDNSNSDAEIHAAIDPEMRKALQDPKKVVKKAEGDSFGHWQSVSEAPACAKQGAKKQG